MDLKGLNKLQDRKINHNERWVYSASFDVPDLRDTTRIDEEIEDINQILESGAKLSILSHQGRYEDNNTLHLDFVADYLSKKLGKSVRYFPENNSESAIEFSKSLKPGEAAIFGNVRFNAGESKNDATLAKQFSKLGDFIAIGGISKAHRKNSSNNGILNYLPGFIARSLIKNMEFLEPWVGEKDKYSVAVLGGIKKEKILVGLSGFSKIYDAIIPGGIVLNTILKSQGYEIGDSLIDEYGKTFENETKQILDNPLKKAEILIPKKVIVARKTLTAFEDSHLIDISQGVPRGYSIVDYELDEASLKVLERGVSETGRFLLAGTPGIYTKGFTKATDQCISYFEKPNVKSIVFGGDSRREIPFSGIKASGGGSSLEYIIWGTLEVCEALMKNKQKFNNN